MALTKDRIALSIQDQLDVSRTKAASLVDVTFELMKATLANAEDLLISGFGKFSVRNKRERKGRNPASGTEIMLGARRVVTFSCSSVLRERIKESSA